MATVIPQVPDKAKDVQADAAVAASVPALRDQVVKLAEQVEALQEMVDRLLVNSRRRP